MSAPQQRQRSTGGAFGVTGSRVEPRADGATGGPTGARNGRPRGRPGNVVLEKPGQQQDDDDERDETATDVHSGLLYARLT
jgi:hypothetical protein